MKRILIVDDIDDLRENIRDILEMENFQISTARNGLEGLEKIMMEKPDLVITDLLMPEMTGLELLQKVKETDATKDIPVIIFSALTDPINMEIAKSLNVDGYITKPCSSTDLLDEIHKIINV
ncbi:response regulator [Fulvivirga lutea]|uniref:Response regulator n=1 Tax=Fulvivirga lutea TaxID=2810512 RepID=A0A975A2R2_9BACT|nr:response regulator [Fulvivirga lutea]QSE98817.1 response regulator [Fulvivirga lutea]